MTVHAASRFSELSSGDATGLCDNRCVDGSPDRTGLGMMYRRARCSNVTPRSDSGGIQSIVPEYQSKARFRHVFAGRRRASPFRTGTAVQPTGNTLFSHVTGRYQIDLLRRLKEAHSIDTLDQRVSSDARPAHEWLGGQGLRARTSHALTVNSRTNLDQRLVKGAPIEKHGFALDCSRAAGLHTGIGRHTLDNSKSVNAQEESQQRLHNGTVAAATGSHTTVHTPRTSNAARTACSCPAACRSHADRTQSGRSHPARLRMKLSSRLSFEAQCAIDETRREMGASLTASDSDGDEDGDKRKEISAPSTCSEDTDPRTSADTSPDVTSSAENATNAQCCMSSRLAKTKENIRPRTQPQFKLPGRSLDTVIHNALGTVHECHFDGRVNEERTFTSGGGLPALASLDGALNSPNALASGAGKPVNNNTERSARLMSLSHCYRAVPHLRKARERTFEITPPWYDSRYADDPTRLPVCAPVEPPKDITDQAVQKCTEWLQKYM